MSDQESKRLTHEEIVELLPAFVVGALDPDEMLGVEEYLAAHPELVGRVHDLGLAAAKLAYVAPSQPLPKELHGKVMGRARASLPPRQQSLPPVLLPEPLSAPPLTLPVARPPRESGLRAWWRKRGWFDLGLVAAAAAVLVLGLVYRGALGEIDTLRQQVQGLEQQVAAIQEQNTNLQNENIRLQSELDTNQNQMASIAGAQHMVTLGGTDAAPSASGRLYVHDTVGTLVLTNLDGLPEDLVYQLWLIPPDGTPIPAGLLGGAGQPMETITLSLPMTLETIAAVGVSVEPPGGSSAPTGAIVLLGERTL